MVNDGPGFLVNRLLLPYMNEAALLLGEGAAIKDIDRAAKIVRHADGADHAVRRGRLDTAVHAGRVMAEAFPDRVVASPLLREAGQARPPRPESRPGFFAYGPAKGGKPPRGTDSAEVAKLIESCRTGAPRKFSQEELTDRLFLPMLLEATRILEDKIVRDVRDVDLGLIFGIGFPPFKGGLLFWADTLGAGQDRREAQAATRRSANASNQRRCSRNWPQANSQFYD